MIEWIIGAVVWAKIISDVKRERPARSTPPPPPSVRRYATYQDYLSSEVWHEKRLLVLKRCGGMCEAPGCRARAEQVHHDRYPDFPMQYGDEPIEWLRGLCDWHHRREHNLEGSRYGQRHH